MHLHWKRALHSGPVNSFRAIPINLFDYASNLVVLWWRLPSGMELPAPTERAFHQPDANMNKSASSGSFPTFSLRAVLARKKKRKKKKKKRGCGGRADNTVTWLHAVYKLKKKKWSRHTWDDKSSYLDDRTLTDKIHTERELKESNTGGIYCI